MLMQMQTIIQMKNWKKDRSVFSPKLDDAPDYDAEAGSSKGDFK